MLSPLRKVKKEVWTPMLQGTKFYIILCLNNLKLVSASWRIVFLVAWCQILHFQSGLNVGFPLKIMASTLSINKILL